MSQTAIAPTEIRVARDRKAMTLAWPDASSATLPAEMLRVLSPSAEVRGHSEAERKTVPGKRHVEIAAVAPVGNYAVRISFSDGHDTGIFTWNYLHELCTEGDAPWQRYLRELSEKGLSRD